MKDLIAKYDVPAPRYTSYPTVPYWSGPPSESQWLEHLQEALKRSDWSLYLHIPYCETLCTFCGCNTIITKDHRREEPYVGHLLAEWNLYRSLVPDLTKRALRHLHLGGGTPTFLSADSLQRLLEPILETTVRSDDFEGSFEADPRRTNEEQLRRLRDLGFDRISMGIQDFNPEVQHLVNRVQDFSITERLTKQARDMGYRSVNFDLIYGLAKQTPDMMKRTIELTLKLSPDRIAFYSFALVPWIKPAQRLFKDEDLPKPEMKRQLYEMARKEFLEAGYIDVGMDHFAKPTDLLAQALKEGRLHRNFMGYTDQRTDVLLGLGVSSISETPFSFHQNQKVLPDYVRSLENGKVPTFRGHVLSEEDRRRRDQILKLMTTYATQTEDTSQSQGARSFLNEMIKDDLVQVRDDRVEITEKGRPFLRNACLFFDEHLKRKQPETRIFSQSI